MATTLTPQSDVTSGEAYIKSIKNPIKQQQQQNSSLNLKLVTHLSTISMHT